MAHETVLLQESIDALEILPTDVVIDATVGGAGHFSLLMKVLGSEGTLIGIDADADAISRAQKVYDDAEESPKMYLVEDNFRNVSSILKDRAIETIDKALFDLGWSGYQLSRGRGFSFQTDEPLLMTYADPSAQASNEDFLTAASFINTASEEDIANVLFELGEEQFSRRIAHGIIATRKNARILTTFQLVDVIQTSTPSWYHHRKLHPATKTFQALRMYVNDELGALREGLHGALAHLSSRGRIAVITFHSIEDRIVKNIFRDEVVRGIGSLVYKKPLAPGAEELSKNPRARSAKLRVFQKN